MEERKAVTTAVDDKNKTYENSETMENTVIAKIVYNEKNKKCTIFDEKGQIIGKEYANKLVMNFLSKEVTFTTEKGTLETYDIGTRKKNRSAFYSGNEILKKTI